MNFTDAIQIAKAGNEQGFNFLYTETFKSKYYLSLQYMKNEESAQDVLQDAYIKAFSNLDSLQNPEAFSRWFGKIVSNTAKNALVKKNPVLFTDIATDDNNEEFEYQIEDVNVAYQPERAFTRQETQALVHDLLDELPAEQRMCILMFHLEGYSIKEIAGALGCSENTVKSRLKYGRDNLKIKATALQEKGYKLYNVVPMPLLLFLLRTDLFDLSSGRAFAKVGNQMARQLLDPSTISSYTSASANVQHAFDGHNTLPNYAQTATNVGVEATKAGFLSAMAGKIAVVTLALCIVGAGAIYGLSQINASRQISQGDVVAEATSTPVATVPAVETPMPTETPTTTQEPAGPSVDEIYAEVRQAVINGDPGYEIPGNVSSTDKYGYILYDIDGDGIDEMIVGIEHPGNPYGYHWLSRVFSCERTENGYSLKAIAGELYIEDCIFHIEGVSGLYKAELEERTSGERLCFEIMIQNGELLTARKPEYDFNLTDELHLHTYIDLEWIYMTDENTNDQTGAVSPSNEEIVQDGEYSVLLGLEGRTGTISGDGQEYFDFESYGCGPIYKVQFEDDKMLLWGEMFYADPYTNEKRRILVDGTEFMFSANIDFGYYAEVQEFKDDYNGEIFTYVGGFLFEVQDGTVSALTFVG